MKKSVLIVATLAVSVLAGCGIVPVDPRFGHDGFDPTFVRRPDPVKPNIFVDAGKFLVVDQEPIRVGPRDVGPDGRVTISWALPAGTQYAFDADKGIQIVSESRDQRSQPVELRCQPPAGRQRVFECSYRKPAPGRTVFKYTVNVRGLAPLDPYIVNEF